ncbi:hypothetical protein L202_00959 [Cryptococcus amylolentus CBS 6039]|uniref:Uncharacterized protein n=1 Tax=Cryptococcus amylolentus CBS 6039 TaxID=1295533 RepID=A0A1E3I246_9TREE|nr:hypothetical protein L202_00959 [Cryptococcus amylolentus CBS 6039]ODN82662.1 hypothetical protein L202_00959 [Cryptococcus amylolentus CBS 6039]
MGNWVPLDAYWSCESPFNALYILYVKKTLELYEEGFENRDIPISESELQLRKKSEGVNFGDLLSEFGDISRTPVRGYDE